MGGIRPAPRGDRKIMVSFEINVNGILKVTAEELGSGNKDSITITNDHNRLSKADIERMVNNTKRLAEEDKRFTERKVVFHELEEYAYFVKRVLGEKELGEEFAKDKEIVIKIVKDTLKWIKLNPKANKVKSQAQKRELKRVAQPIIDKLYGNTARQNPKQDKDEL